MEGFLTKQGHVVKNWKVRWVCLENDEFSYYKDQTKFVLKKTCTLNASSTVGSSPDVDGHKNIIIVNTLQSSSFPMPGIPGMGSFPGMGMGMNLGGLRKKNKDIVLSADNPQTKVLWIKAIQTAIDRIRGNVASMENYNKTVQAPGSTGASASTSNNNGQSGAKATPVISHATSARFSEETSPPSEETPRTSHIQNNSGATGTGGGGGDSESDEELAANAFSKPKRKNNGTRRRVKRNSNNEDDPAALTTPDANIFNTPNPTSISPAAYDFDLPRVSEIAKDNAAYYTPSSNNRRPGGNNNTIQKQSSASSPLTTSSSKQSAPFAAANNMDSSDDSDSSDEEEEEEAQPKASSGKATKTNLYDNWVEVSCHSLFLMLPHVNVYVCAMT